MILPPCLSSRLWWSFFALLLIGPTTPAVKAQQPQQQPERTVSATMLRALSETADVYRTGKPVWLVADYRYPHNVLPGFTDLAAAQRAQTDSAANYGIFGPYVTARDPIPATAPRVVSVRVTTQTPAGQKTQTVDPRVTDALFFSLSAVDKFVLPYYEKTFGPDYAAELRKKILEGFQSGAFVRHCWSIHCWDPKNLIRVFDPAALQSRDSSAPGVRDTTPAAPR